jgi:hypothetical protein
LFFGACFVVGCAGMITIVVTLVIPEWRVNHAFQESRCTVRDKQIATQATEQGTTYRPELLIRYDVDGASYTVWTYDVRGDYAPDEQAAQAVLDRFEKDEEYPCWYDPLAPQVAVLTRVYSGWFWLTLIVPASFIVIGGGGTAYALMGWAVSAERRAAMAKRAAQLDPFDPQRAAHEHPCVPIPRDVINSPGTTLTYRLPPENSPAWLLSVWFGACLVWNGLLTPFVVIAVHGILAGGPDWGLVGFVVPFLAVGVGLIAYFVRQFIVTTRVGPTLVEVSQLPMYPGGTYEVFVQQAGRLTVKELDVLLVCEEEATFRHGTNTRTEVRCVFQQPLVHRESFEIRFGEPFSTQCPLQVPAAAMHSFKSAHNEISWKLVVRGEVNGWPRYERSYPLVVYPSRNGNGPS